MAKGHYIVMCSYCKKHLKTIETDEARMVGTISHSTCESCAKTLKEEIKRIIERRRCP